MKDSLRILVNATTLTVGGGVPIGVSFIEHVVGDDYNDFEFMFAVSRQIYDNLPACLQKDSRIRSFDVSPAKIIKGHSSRVMLKTIERSFRPDVVYSLGFPSYVRFGVPEVGRYTNCWEINPPPIPWHVLSPMKRILVFIAGQYRLWWASRASYFETQTEFAKAGIQKKLGITADRVKVIPNSVNPIFLKKAQSGVLYPDTEIKIFCLAADFPHKNIGIIPFVAAALKDLAPEKSFKFLITLPPQSAGYKRLLATSKALNVSGMVENLGPLMLADCVLWYERSSIVFLPTLLEIFSVTYLEAMAMSRPIVTTDLGFAREICGDAALYFDHRSPAAAAQRIAELAHNPEISAKLVRLGQERLAAFPSPEEKHQIVLDWLKEIACLARGQSRV